jgi:hypothetical protein
MHISRAANRAGREVVLPGLDVIRLCKMQRGQLEVPFYLCCDPGKGYQHLVHSSTYYIFPYALPFTQALLEIDGENDKRA